MKYLNDAEVKVGNAVVHLAPDGTPVVGLVHQLYTDKNLLIISGYALPVKSSEACLATDAFNALAGPIAQAKAEAALKGKTEAEAQAEAALKTGNN